MSEIITINTGNLRQFKDNIKEKFFKNAKVTSEDVFKLIISFDNIKEIIDFTDYLINQYGVSDSLYFYLKQTKYIIGNINYYHLLNNIDIQEISNNYDYYSEVLLFDLKKECKQKYLNLKDLCSFEDEPLFKDYKVMFNNPGPQITNEIPVRVIDISNFDDNFSKITENVFEGMCWDNIILSGGFMNLILHPTLNKNYKKISNFDFDLFIYGENKEIKQKTLKNILKFFSFKRDCYIVVKNKSIIEIYLPDLPTIQIIITDKSHLIDILFKFDFSHVQVAYNGKHVLGTYNYMLSQIYNVSMVRKDTISSNRLYKTVVDRNYKLISNMDFMIETDYKIDPNNTTIEELYNLEYTKKRLYHYYKIYTELGYNKDKIIYDLRLYNPKAIKIIEAKYYYKINFDELNFELNFNNYY